ncbi:MAG: SDR family NAD(P)-dependent oxidoreductase [Gemmatimonadetes bacterium]|nr:SDR family NAD(P)-dependent oxidoreductase [Gemmatimonadota bacterium]MYG83925.1 SDR family NAD(P)-dependent oxidoreductase [Gemmatimonadota bacterium]MYJ91113.1 SDR family NAD(P)-dependent oxidoreductase [Gemmatimonadota bacterium]
MPNPLTKTARHLLRMFLPKPMAEPVDMSGRHVIVTGASPGSLGYEAARILAGWGATVVATRVRDVVLMEAALKDDLRKRGTNADKLSAHALDLSDPHSVNAFATWYRESHQGKLHVLVNNAGIHRKTLAPRTETPLTDDGFEVHWRTNYLGAFHLTRALLPLLQQSGLESGDARIVNVSSGLHDRVGNADLFGEIAHRHRSNRDLPRRNLTHGDLPPHDRPRYHSWDAYGKSKLAMNHMAFEIERRFAESHNLHGVAVHPGVVMTNLTLPQAFRGRIGKAAHRISSALASLVLLSPTAGAQTIVMCASQRPLQGGKYYEHCAVAEPSVDSLDADASKRLWEQSVRWVGAIE